MKINDLESFFEIQKEQTKSKQEKKEYNNLVGIFSELKRKNLTKQQWKSIEDEVEKLRLTAVSEERNIRLRKKRNQLIKFLKNNFSFILKGHFTGLGMSMGIALGTAIGMIFGMLAGIPMGMVYGMMIGAMAGLLAGLILGKIKDNDAEKENRVIQTQIS